MTPQDRTLLERLRDLHGSLGAEVGWLARTFTDDVPRADVLRDLGERMTDLAQALLARSAELDAAVLASLPSHGWLPEAGIRPRVPALAHQVGPRPLRCGPIYLSLCGAACFPFYGTDPQGETARHDRCPTCTVRVAVRGFLVREAAVSC